MKKKTFNYQATRPAMQINVDILVEIIAVLAKTGYIWLQHRLATTAYDQGCGVRVETGVGVGRSRLFWPESESELESVKFGRLRLRPGVAG